MARHSPLRQIAGPLGGVMLFALCVGLVGVWLMRSPTETDLIARYAAAYQRDTGNAVTDCYGRPAEVEGVRLYVVCAPRGGEPHVFLLNNRGRRVDLPSLEQIVRTSALEARWKN